METQIKNHLFYNSHFFKDQINKNLFHLIINLVINSFKAQIAIKIKIILFSRQFLQIQKLIN